MNRPPAPILILSGPSGAGKTTVGRLVAASFDVSVHIQADAFMPFIASGWVEPWLPASVHQNDVLGGAIAAAALEFAVGGHTVVLDGHLFPDGVDGMSTWSTRRNVPLHYAVLRPDLATCVARARQRRPGDADDSESLAQLHARFMGLGRWERHVVVATGPPEEVASSVLASISSGRLVVGGQVDAAIESPEIAT